MAGNYHDGSAMRKSNLSAPAALKAAFGKKTIS